MVKIISVATIPDTPTVKRKLRGKQCYILGVRNGVPYGTVQGQQGEYVFNHIHLAPEIIDSMREKAKNDEMYMDILRHVSKTLDITVTCQARYTSSIEVPLDMSLEEAFEHAKKELNEIGSGEFLEHIEGSDVIDMGRFRKERGIVSGKPQEEGEKV